MTDIYEKTIEDLGGLMIKFFGCNRITMPIQQAIVLLEAHENVVRCKDCKHWEQSNGHCPFNSIFTNADWFCADGERRGSE